MTSGCFDDERVTTYAMIAAVYLGVGKVLARFGLAMQRLHPRHGCSYAEGLL